MSHSRKAGLLLTAATLATLSTPAWALDGQDLLAKINAAYAAGSGVVAAKSVEIDGDNVTLAEATFTATGAGAHSIDLGDIELQGVSEADDGGYLIERIDFPTIDFKDDKTAIAVADLYISGMHVPGDTTTGDINSLMLYEEAHSGPASVTVDGKTVFSIEEAQATMSVADDDQSLAFDASVTGIKGDMAAIEDPKARDAIEKLNLTSLDGDITVNGTWELPSGTISVDEYAFDFANVGRLDLSFQLSGYTMQLVKQMQETARTMQGDPNNQQAQQMAGLAMLGMMQQMNFIDATIRFEDGGITKRGLDYAGAQQGTTGEQMAQMVKAMTPILLAQANLGALQNSVSAAVNAFVDAPGSFTITAEPENAVPFPMIMGAGMGAPETLPQLLGVSVTAND